MEDQGTTGDREEDISALEVPRSTLALAPGMHGVRLGGVAEIGSRDVINKIMCRSHCERLHTDGLVYARGVGCKESRFDLS